MNSKDKNSFDKKGFLVVKNIFSEEEISSLRQAYKNMKDLCIERNLCNSLENSPELFLLKGDLCSYPQLKPFKYLVFDERIINVVKKLIGDEITYFGESNCQSGPTPGGYHKDNRLEDRENLNIEQVPSEITLQGANNNREQNSPLSTSSLPLLADRK